jgi:hypothetical protein
MPQLRPRRTVRLDGDGEPHRIRVHAEGGEQIESGSPAPVPPAYRRRLMAQRITASRTASPIRMVIVNMRFLEPEA